MALTKEEQELLLIPNKIYFGFERGITAQDYKDVESYIHGYVEKNFESNKNAYYKIKKIKGHPWLPDGHMFEIQEGKTGVSYLEGLLKKLDIKDEVFIKTKTRQVLIEKKYDGFDCYYLTEELQPEFDTLDMEKKIAPLNKQGYAIFWFSIIMFSISVISLFLSILFKYVLFDKTAVYIVEKDFRPLPIKEIITHFDFGGTDYTKQTIAVKYKLKNVQNITKEMLENPSEIKNNNREWEVIKKNFNYIQDENGSYKPEPEVTYNKTSIYVSKGITDLASNQAKKNEVINNKEKEVKKTNKTTSDKANTKVKK